MIVTGHSDYDGVQKNIEYLTKDFEENKTKIIVSLLGSCTMQVKSKLCSYIRQSDASGVAAPPVPELQNICILNQSCNQDCDL